MAPLCQKRETFIHFFPPILSTLPFLQKYETIKCICDVLCMSDCIQLWKDALGEMYGPVLNEGFQSVYSMYSQ